MGGIAVRSLSKVYRKGAVAAVDDVSLEVPDGALAVIVGPSGCGKTTLLRMIAGLETATAGEIVIAGRPVNALGPAERDIAMVFQNYALYPHMSVYDNLAYGLRNRKTPRPEIDRRVREAARLLELEPMLARRPRELSGGQRQRVAMGRAIVRHPQAFLFDEPLSNLDAKLRVQMRLEIRALQRRLKTTSIYVTHDQLEAMTLADVLVVMNGGRVEQVGAPLELYQRPATAFVAGFIGSPAMNLLPARSAGACRLALAGGGTLALRYDLALPSGDFVIGFRPEDVQPHGDGDVVFAVHSEWVESVGADTFVYGRIETAEGARMVMRRPGGFAAPGGTITVSLAADRVHLFDGKSGARIAPVR